MQNSHSNRDLTVLELLAFDAQKFNPAKPPFQNILRGHVCCPDSPWEHAHQIRSQ